MVIYGHAYAIIPTKDQRDPISQIISFDYSGSLAVKIFFFLSGLVVTNSLIEKKNIQEFIVSRFFRIWPALTIVLISMAFVIGPILSNHSLKDYFSNPLVYKYVWQGLILGIQYDLPGVFPHNASSAANGSLWSIPFEAYAYVALAAVFLIGIFRVKLIPIVLFIYII